MCVHNKPQNPLSTQVVTEPVDRALSTTMEPEAPVLAVYLPILRLHIVSNTFIRYLNVATGTERVGLVLSVRPDKRVLRVREFLTWPEVKARYPICLVHFRVGLRTLVIHQNFYATVISLLRSRWLMLGLWRLFFTTPMSVFAG